MERNSQETHTAMVVARTKKKERETETGEARANAKLESRRKSQSVHA